MRIQSKPSKLHPVAEWDGPRNTVYFYVAAVHQWHPLVIILIARSVTLRKDGDLKDCIADTFSTLAAA